MIEKILEGKLNLFSDQGMEGGALSIQDKEHINLNTPMFGVTDNVKVWDKNDISRFGTTSNPEVFINKSWLPWPDPLYKDPDYKNSSLNLEKKSDLMADKIISERYDIKIKYVDDILNEKYGENNWKYKTTKESEIILNNGEIIHIGYSPISEPARPYGIPQGALTRVTIKWNDSTIEQKRKSDTLLIEQWSYEGLHMLKETDIIKVKDPITKRIICESQIDSIPLKLFSQTMKGHFEQINESINEISDWEKYFTKQYSAELHREIK
jgi:hypothetical protein